MQDDIVKQQPEAPKPVGDVTSPPAPETPEAPPENEAKPGAEQQAIDSSVVEEKPAESPEQAADQPAPKAQKPKSTKPIGVIIAASVVCLSLVAGAVYVGVLKKDPQEVSKTSQQSTQNTKVEAASELDAALNEASQLPESQDNPSAELTDQSLGL